jgi:tetratricopeptide (TPR) repeat protein
MDDLLHNENLLIRYLDDELDNEEKAALEQRLQTDANLQKQLTSLQIAIQAVNHYGTSQQVGAIHLQMMQELKPQRPKVFSINKTVRYTMAVAASILILFIGVRVYLSAQLSPEKLYNESFVDFTVSDTRGSSSAISEIERRYQQKEYTSVLNAQRSTNLYAKDSLLIGLSYLHTDQLTDAIRFFQKIAFTNNDFQQDAEFYLSLSYLKNKDYDKALPLMEKIESTSLHLYHAQITADFINKVKKLNNK